MLDGLCWSYGAKKAEIIGVLGKKSRFVYMLCGGKAVTLQRKWKENLLDLASGCALAEILKKETEIE